MKCDGVVGVTAGSGRRLGRPSTIGDGRSQRTDTMSSAKPSSSGRPEQASVDDKSTGVRVSPQRRTRMSSTSVPTDGGTLAMGHAWSEPVWL